MKHFNYNISSADDYIAETKKGLHSPNREFVAHHEHLLKDAYERYISHINPCTLEEIYPVWPILKEDAPDTKVQKKKDRKMLHDMYETKEAFKDAHWNAVRAQNGDVDLICPICGVNDCYHLDHYIPREKMPEFSVFTPNLIPLCYDCNEEKKAAWLNGNNERIIFNAFYDEVPIKPLCDCEIDIDETGQPRASLKPSAQLDLNNAVDRRVLTTIEQLKLLSRWQKKCDARFRAAVSLMKRQYKYNARKELNDYWEDICSMLHENVNEATVSTFIDVAIYEAIINSVKFKRMAIGLFAQRVSYSGLNNIVFRMQK